MKSEPPPDWLDCAQVYYSEIEWRRGSPVNVFLAPADGEVSDATPGTLCLRLEPRFPLVRVSNAEGAEVGVIRSEGIVPGVKYVMRRSGAPIWVLSVRSLVRKRHRLELAGDRWTFDTPFYWWQHLTGTTQGLPRLVGLVGPSKRFWGMGIEPGWDSQDLLAAVAYLHRKWWQW